MTSGCGSSTTADRATGAVRHGSPRQRVRPVRAREPLPSITQLTGETGLAVGTVRKAIAVLVDEGYAYTVPGRGTYVAERDG